MTESKTLNVAWTKKYGARASFIAVAVRCLNVRSASGLGGNPQTY